MDATQSDNKNLIQNQAEPVNRHSPPKKSIDKQEAHAKMSTATVIREKTTKRHRLAPF